MSVNGPKYAAHYFIAGGSFGSVFCPPFPCADSSEFTDASNRKLVSKLCYKVEGEAEYKNGESIRLALDDRGRALMGCINPVTKEPTIVYNSGIYALTKCPLVDVTNEQSKTRFKELETRKADADIRRVFDLITSLNQGLEVENDSYRRKGFVEKIKPIILNGLNMTVMQMERGDGNCDDAALFFHGKTWNLVQKIAWLKAIRDLVHNVRSMHDKTWYHLDMKSLNLVYFGSIECPYAIKMIDFGLSQSSLTFKADDCYPTHNFWDTWSPYSFYLWQCVKFKRTKIADIKQFYVNLENVQINYRVLPAEIKTVMDNFLVDIPSNQRKITDAMFLRKYLACLDIFGLTQMMSRLFNDDKSKSLHAQARKLELSTADLVQHLTTEIRSIIIPTQWKDFDEQVLTATGVFSVKLQAPSKKKRFFVIDKSSLIFPKSQIESPLSWPLVNRVDLKRCTSERHFQAYLKKNTAFQRHIQFLSQKYPFVNGGTGPEPVQTDIENGTGLSVYSFACDWKLVYNLNQVVKQKKKLNNWQPAHFFKELITIAEFLRDSMPKYSTDDTNVLVFVDDDGLYRLKIFYWVDAVEQVGNGSNVQDMARIVVKLCDYLDFKVTETFIKYFTNTIDNMDELVTDLDSIRKQFVVLKNVQLPKKDSGMTGFLKTGRIELVLEGT